MLDGCETHRHAQSHIDPRCTTRAATTEVQALQPDKKLTKGTFQCASTTWTSMRWAWAAVLRCEPGHDDSHPVILITGTALTEIQERKRPKKNKKDEEKHKEK